MTLSIDNFKSKINPAVTNRYNIIISNPDILETPYSFLAKEVTLPGQNINSTTIMIQGMNRNVASNIDFDAISITFVVDRDMKIYKAIEKWQNNIYNKSERINYFLNDYKSDMFIEVLNKNGEVVMKVKVFDVWPKSIPDTQLGYDNDSQSFELNVSFENYGWEIVE